MSKGDFFPEIITNLPEADIPIEGLHSYLFQGENQQFVFMSFENDVEVAEHSHEAQWGVVLDGESELTIAGKNALLQKGIHTLFLKMLSTVQELKKVTRI